MGEESKKLASTKVVNAGKFTRPVLGGVVKPNNKAKYFWRSIFLFHSCPVLLVLVAKEVFILLMLVVQIKDPPGTLLARDQGG